MAKNNSTIAHNFIHRAKLSESGSNISYKLSNEEDNIYSLLSYSTVIALHYGDVIICTSDSYSITTAKHLNHLYSAARNYLPVIKTDLKLSGGLTSYSENKSSFKKKILASKYINIVEAIHDLQNPKTRKVAEHLRRLCDILIDINRLKKDHHFTMINDTDILNLKNYNIGSKDHYDYLIVKFFAIQQIENAYFALKNIHDGSGHVLLNSLSKWLQLDLVAKYNKEAEANKKREATRLANYEKQKQLAALADAEKLELWLKGEYNYNLYNIDPHLRIKNKNILQTSQGAEVPLQDAIELYLKLKAGSDIIGTLIGNFTVLNVDSDTIKIGCHIIKRTTIDSFFNSLTN